MNSPVASRLDDLALQTTIIDYGDAILAKIPGHEDLSLEEQVQVIERAQQLQAERPLDADRLIEALRDMTQPPTEPEVREERDRQLEAESRRKLEAEGCPPCHPADVDFYTMEGASDECRAIVGYWESFPWTDNAPLSAQLCEWNKFRIHQQRKRLRSVEKYEREVRQRRQRHGLDDDVRLTMEIDQQTPLDRWIEFQDYELVHLEEFEKKLDHEKEQDRLEDSELEREREWDKVRKDNPDAIIPMLMHPVEQLEGYIKQHMVLLTWIEQQRQLMLLDKSATASCNNSPAQEPETGTGPEAELEPEPKSEPEAESNSAVANNSDVKPRNTATQKRPKLRNPIKRYNNTRRSENRPLLRRQLGLRRATKRKSRSRRLALKGPPHETVPELSQKSKLPEQGVSSE
ncbi:hypothetical protein F5Y14DRAFT_14000 [Nemania sp. NC0429]|nr:hypothetical protein F5Y14DRAFT_14000 [Nemania sp. NC0429]